MKPLKERKKKYTLDWLKKQNFDKLIVLEEAERKNRRKRMVLCKCECGNTKRIQVHSLINGLSTSCGCWNKECRQTHNMSYTSIYKVFISLRKRCNNSKDYAYNRYGGRGIKCLRNSFEEFYKDMGDGYEEGLTIDRINNDGNYCKENCRWTTREEQQQNQGRSILLEYNGKKQHINKWSKELGININTLYSRYKYGWSTKNILRKELNKHVI